MRIFFAIGVFVAFILAIITFFKNKREQSDNVLFIWLIVIGLHLLGYYFYCFGNWYDLAIVIGAVHPLPLVHGPFLYLFIKSSIDRERYFSWRDTLNFLPALLMYLYMIPFFLGSGGHEKILNNDQETSETSTFMVVSMISYILSGFGYLTVSFFWLRKEWKITRSKNRENIFSLMCGFMVSTCMVFLLAGILYLSQGIGWVIFHTNVDFFIYSVATVCLFGLTYHVINNSDWRKLYTSWRKGNRDAGPLTYEDVGDDDDMQNFQLVLTKVMEEKRLYLDPECNPESLSERTGIPKKILSRIIKEKGFNNFKDYINYYRVEEFKYRMKKPENATRYDIFSVAYDSGFRAKSTFYDNFKKLTGETPSSYIHKREKERE